MSNSRDLTVLVKKACANCWIGPMLTQQVADEFDRLLEEPEPSVSDEVVQVRLARLQVAIALRSGK